MKNSQPSHHEGSAGDLQHYLHERPDLLLKMLDIAETRWRESKPLDVTRRSAKAA